jgi:hypothetical protein
MGVGIDAYDQGARMGIASDATVAYDHRDPAAVHAAFVGSAQSTRRFAEGAAPTTAYAPEEKAAAGDRFGNVVRKATRQLKKAIVDDITL